MNRINIISFASVFILLSCNVEDNIVDNIQNKPSAVKCPVFKAHFNKDLSKTLIDDIWGDISWSDSDSISIFTSSYNDGVGVKFICDEGGETAIFNSTDQSFSAQGPFYALYPFSQSASCNFNSKQIKTILPEKQQLIQSTFDPVSFISVGYSDVNTEIGFSNVCGGIRFTVANSKINKVVFKSNNGELLSGNIIINISGSKPSAYYDSNDSYASDSIILISNSYLESGKHYYISSLPQELVSGFTFRFYDGDNLISSTVCNAPIEIKRSVFSTIKTADEQSSIDKILDGLDVSANGTANSYIIPGPGYYKFLMTKGNETQPIVSVDSLSLLWETVNTNSIISKNSVISNLAHKGSYAYFSTPDDFVSGNALIAAYSKGKIIWSWHIWCCEDYDPELTEQLYKAGSKYMMDRNLGALSSDKDNALSIGLMYQWGRKDPFMGAASFSKDSGIMYSTNPQTSQKTLVTAEYSVQIPTVFICSTTTTKDWMEIKDNSLWSSSGSTKTKYDPCPAGWRVPYGGSDKANPWVDVEMKYVKSSNSSGPQGVLLSVVSPKGAEAWYPSCGYLSAEDFSLKMSGEIGFYHTATPESTGKTVYAYQFNTVYGSTSQDNYYPSMANKVRAEGRSVRCIKE